MVLPKSFAKECDLRSEKYDFRCERIVIIIGCVELLAETCVLRSEGVVFRFERDVSRGACPTCPGGLRPLVALIVGHFGSQSGLDEPTISSKWTPRSQIQTQHTDFLASSAPSRTLSHFLLLYWPS